MFHENHRKTLRCRSQLPGVQHFEPATNWDIKESTDHKLACLLTFPLPGCLLNLRLPGTLCVPSLSTSPLPHAEGQMKCSLYYYLWCWGGEGEGEGRRNGRWKERGEERGEGEGEERGGEIEDGRWSDIKGHTLYPGCVGRKDVFLCPCSLGTGLTSSRGMSESMQLCAWELFRVNQC